MGSYFPLMTIRRSLNPPVQNGTETWGLKIAMYILKLLLDTLTRTVKIMVAKLN